nr:hypothetical protein Iba_chr02dCG12240 [Ipomoea batatas]
MGIPPDGAKVSWCTEVPIDLSGRSHHYEIAGGGPRLVSVQSRWSHISDPNSTGPVLFQRHLYLYMGIRVGCRPSEVIGTDDDYRRIRQDLLDWPFRVSVPIMNDVTEGQNGANDCKTTIRKAYSSHASDRNYLALNQQTYTSPNTDALQKPTECYSIRPMPRLLQELIRIVYSQRRTGGERRRSHRYAHSGHLEEESDLESIDSFVLCVDKGECRSKQRQKIDPKAREYSTRGNELRRYSVKTSHCAV